MHFFFRILVVGGGTKVWAMSRGEGKCVCLVFSCQIYKINKQTCSKKKKNLVVARGRSVGGSKKAGGTNVWTMSRERNWAILCFR